MGVRARRLARAERERDSLLAQTVFLGTLALLFVLPLVAGAYLGHWADTRTPGYAYRWTMAGLVGGLAVGMLNVWAFVRRHGG